MPPRRRSPPAVLALRVVLVGLVLAPCAAAGFEDFFQQQAAAGGGGGGARETEYYDRLGVDPGCSEAELKRAYKRKSLAAHPDRGGSEETFKELNEAYQVLSDPQKREVYDRHGKAAVDGSAPGGAGGGGGGFGGFPGGFPGGFGGGGFAGGFGGGGVDMQDLFQQLFRRQQMRVVQVELSLEELYSGATKTYAFSDPRTGERREVRVRIQPGMEPGTRLPVPGTNMVFQLAERRHARFERHGDNLHMPLSLSLYEALTGFQRPIKHLDGRRLWVSAEREATRPGVVRGLALGGAGAGRGAPSSGGRGPA